MIGGPQRRLEMCARVLDRRERGVERLHGRLDQAAGLAGAAFELAQRRRQRGHRRLAAAHRLVGITQIARHLFRLHHGGALVGKRRLLRRRRRER